MPSDEVDGSSDRSAEAGDEPARGRGRQQPAGGDRVLELREQGALAIGRPAATTCPRSR
jgi:hypothetical protein